MEILVTKIPNHCQADNYNGVIAYGTGADGQAYVLTTQPPDSERKWFVICQAKQTQTQEIFAEDDEMGDGLVFDYYDEAIQGFQYFLKNCNLSE